MRKLLLLFILSSLFSIANGQTVITGKVTDNKNNPVVGASITIKNSYDGAVSDSAGKFRFSTTETGEQLLTISGVWYKIF
jgi:hypothetical protein